MHKGTVGLEEGWDWGLKKCPAQAAPTSFCFVLAISLPVCPSPFTLSLSVNPAVTHPLPFQPFLSFSLFLPACQASWLVLPGFMSPEGSPLPCMA